MLNRKSNILLFLFLVLICLSINSIYAVNDISLNESSNIDEISQSNYTSNINSIGVYNDDNIDSSVKVSQLSNSDGTENDNSRVLSESNHGTFTDLQNLINNASENATLILEKDYIYTPSVDHGYIFIRNPITIIGNNHILNANNRTDFFNVHADNVVLKDISFINGKGHYTDGAIYWTGKYGKLINCSFINNTLLTAGASAIYWAGHYGYIENSRFINNTVNANGGAIFWFSYYGKVKNSLFVNNTAKNLGGASFIFMNQLEVLNSTFINNRGNPNMDDIFYYYCLNENLSPPGNNSYIILDFSNVTNSKNKEYVGDYIKVLFYNYEEYANQNRIWIFTDGDFRNSNDTIIKKVIYDVDVNHLILNNTPIKYLNKTTAVEYSFVLLKSLDLSFQDLFAYKKTVININNNTPVNNTTVVHNNTNKTGHNNTNKTGHNTPNNKGIDKKIHKTVTAATYKTGNPLYLLLVVLLSLCIIRFKN
ncbi:MAG: hypothetical protein ACI4VU_02045 [Methanobrevibacter sp.]